MPLGLLLSAQYCVGYRGGSIYGHGCCRSGMGHAARAGDLRHNLIDHADAHPLKDGRQGHEALFKRHIHADGAYSPSFHSPAIHDLYRHDACPERRQHIRLGGPCGLLRINQDRQYSHSAVQRYRERDEPIHRAEHRSGKR